MKRAWNCLVNFFESMGRARAAGILVRQGRIKEAKDLYHQ